jgi:hypothetical protein
LRRIPSRALLGNPKFQIPNPKQAPTLKFQMPRPNFGVESKEMRAYTYGMAKRRKIKTGPKDAVKEAQTSSIAASTSPAVTFSSVLIICSFQEYSIKKTLI